MQICAHICIYVLIYSYGAHTCIYARMHTYIREAITIFMLRRGYLQCRWQFSRTTHFYVAHVSAFILSLQIRVSQSDQGRKVAQWLCNCCTVLGKPVLELCPSPVFLPPVYSGVHRQRGWVWGGRLCMGPPPDLPRLIPINSANKCFCRGT